MKVKYIDPENITRSRSTIDYINFDVLMGFPCLDLADVTSPAVGGPHVPTNPKISPWFSTKAMGNRFSDPLVPKV